MVLLVLEFGSQDFFIIFKKNGVRIITKGNGWLNFIQITNVDVLLAKTKTKKYSVDCLFLFKSKLSNYFVCVVPHKIT